MSLSCRVATCPRISFQHRVMVAALLQKPIGSALSLEEESQHGVFCRAGRVDGGNADLRHGAKRLCHSQGEGAVYAGGYRGRACAASNLPTHRYSRPAEWLRCSTMVYANSDCR